MLLLISFISLSRFKWVILFHPETGDKIYKNCCWKILSLKLFWIVRQNSVFKKTCLLRILVHIYAYICEFPPEASSYFDISGYSIFQFSMARLCLFYNANKQWHLYSYSSIKRIWISCISPSILITKSKIWYYFFSDYFCISKLALIATNFPLNS